MWLLQRAALVGQSIGFANERDGIKLMRCMGFGGRSFDHLRRVGAVGAKAEQLRGRDLWSLFTGAGCGVLISARQGAPTDYK